VLAVAGSLAGKRVSPAGLGTMHTDNPTFVVLLIGVVILVGALTFFPALLLGIVFPLVITGISQVAFPGNANGQQVKVDGKLVGSKIIGQQFATQVIK